MKNCERCGQSFDCAMNRPDEKCWCVQAPPLEPIPKEYKDCLCPKCLSAFHKPQVAAGVPADLVEGEDYYYENDLFVFTEKYLLKRGYCCDNRCRHCPYND
jgi:hypothetical protein